MGRIWNNIKEVVRWAKRPLAHLLAFPIINRGIEKFGRVGQIIAGVSHLADLYYWMRGDNVPWRDGNWYLNHGPPQRESDMQRLNRLAAAERAAQAAET